MRILIVSNYYPPLEIGGWEQLTYDVAQRLIDRGHVISVLTSNYQSDMVTESEPGVTRLLNLESPDHTHYHPYYILFRRVWERRNIRILNQIVSDFKPDIIFVNGMWNLPVNLVQHAEQILSGRVIYYLASTWPTDLDAHTAYWIIHFKTSRFGFLQPLLLGPLKKFFLPKTPRSNLPFLRAMSVSAYLRDYFCERQTIPKSQNRVVYNGVELDRFTPKKWESPKNNVRLIYAGRFTPDKGVHTIIESLQILINKYPNISSTLKLIGNGTPSYSNHLYDLTEKYNIHELISFQDWVARDNMPSILKEYDILIFPSPFPEALPRIVQEAMACGLVVIGTSTGGTPEILEDGVNGLRFEAGNAAMLAEKIAEIACDRERMVALGKAARKTVETRFSLDHMVDELEANFEEIIHGSSW
jgi:glycosyltransferase involved in cell wall biosynthesis